MDRLKKFIVDNGLTFTGTGSGLNGNCTIISGYTDFLGGFTAEDIIKAVQAATGGSEVSAPAALEIKRVYDFAFTYNYGNWWKLPEAKRLYKF